MTEAENARPVAVLYDHRDAERFRASPQDVRAILALTPAARGPAASLGVPLIDTRALMTDLRFARLVVRAHRDRERIARRLGEMDSLSLTARLMAAESCRALGVSALRLWHLLGERGPWLVPQGGEFVRMDRREEAFDAAASHILANYPNLIANYPYSAPPLPGLFLFLRRLAMSLLARWPHASIVSRRTKHPLGLYRLLEGARRPVRQYYVSAVERGALEYLRLLLELVRGLRGERYLQVRALATGPDRGEEIVGTMLAASAEPAFIRVVRLLRKKLAHEIGLTDRMVADMTAVVSRLRPDLLSSYEISDGYSAALAEAAGRAGIVRLILNHNTFTPNTRALSAMGIGDMCRAQYAVGLSDVRLFWNPQGVAAGRQYLPEETWPMMFAIARPEDPPVAPPPQQRPRTVLHAGNSLRWFSLPVWVFETTEEYADGLVELSRVIATLPNTQMIARSKIRWWELNMGTLRALLPPACELRNRNEGSFLEDLAKADLLVATCSTTIFQALRARKPVLLWGGSNRYRHLPARTTLPTRDDRATVYALEKGQPLAPMLDAILDAHAGSPLTDAEIAPYFCPAGTPTVADLAEAIAERDPLKPWRGESRLDAAPLKHARNVGVGQWRISPSG